MTEPTLDDFAFKTRDKLRYGDTDRLGHVNNAVFSTFFETGRVELLHVGEAPPPPGTAFVLARIAIDYRREVNWPGEVVIGTGVEKIGRSSIRLRQALFYNERLCAIAETVIVLMDEASRRSTPLPDEMRERLSALVIGTDDTTDG
ncbi:acyl-CoA thioesterase [Jiella pacifica]|uniref:Acyl-CoA thioesterase n=1 Tax=Jiella pacifica TaxID=2696469 RepID=A0A6N9T2J5_9HYPH|nr:thioesterase family protein [Jiella pacifica]NDW04256.1 acyl-CoA thioesterase [Jiella pacifica]